jgi:membrane protein
MGDRRGEAAVRKSSAEGRRARISRRFDLFALGVLTGLIASLVDVPPRPSRAARGPGVTGPGASARTPFHIPAAGWKAILVRTWTSYNEDRIPAVAGGVTFFLLLLALFPALGAFVSLYGLFADVESARHQIAAMQGFLPGGAVSVMSDQMLRLAAADHGRLGVAFAVSLVVSIWSSNAGVKALIAGLNVTFDATERRSFVILNLVSLAFTLGMTLFTLISVAAVVSAPALLQAVGLDGGMARATLLRWPLLTLVLTGLLALIYRYGPCRSTAHWRWITPGAAVAALTWVGASLLFSWYVANFGHYDRTYGSLGAVVGFMTWIWLSVIVILVGAELDSEIDAQARPV